VADFSQSFILLKKYGFLGVCLLTLCSVIIASCKKSATEQPPVVVPVQRIDLKKDTINIMIGSQSKIGYSIYPANATDTALIFNSANTSIATVQTGGLITGVKLGITQITISSSATGVTATCIVNVTSVQATSLQLSKSALTMIVGQKDTLLATFLPANAGSETLSWKSSNTAVATIDNDGVVTSIAVGNSTINVTTTDGKLTAQCAITVAPVLITSISLNTPTLTLAVGNVDTLKVVVAPSNATPQTFVWNTSSSAVATVTASGVVTAKAAGTATITVKTSDGKFTATCTVTVANPITSISLNKGSLTLAAGAQYTLIASTAPSNAVPQTLVWSSSNSAVASVGNTGLVTAKITGTATVTVKTADGTVGQNCMVTVIANQPLTGEALAAQLITNATYPATYGVLAQLTSTLHTFGTEVLYPEDTTVTASSPSGVIPSFNYSSNWRDSMTRIEQGTPPTAVGLRASYNFKGTGSYNDGSTFSSNYSDAGIFIISYVYSNLPFSITYTRSETVVAETGAKNTFTDKITWNSTNLLVNNQTHIIMSGTATVGIQITASGQVSSYNGTITFSGGTTQATLMLNSGISYPLQW
jgi:uncharacterized protein YjdB